MKHDILRFETHVKCHVSHAFTYIFTSPISYRVYIAVCMHLNGVHNIGDLCITGMDSEKKFRRLGANF